MVAILQGQSVETTSFLVLPYENNPLPNQLRPTCLSRVDTSTFSEPYPLTAGFCLFESEDCLLISTLVNPHWLSQVRVDVMHIWYLYDHPPMTNSDSSSMCQVIVGPTIDFPQISDVSPVHSSPSNKAIFVQQTLKTASSDEELSFKQTLGMAGYLSFSLCVWLGWDCFTYLILFRCLLYNIIYIHIHIHVKSYIYRYIQHQRI